MQTIPEAQTAAEFAAPEITTPPRAVAPERAALLLERAVAIYEKKLTPSSTGGIFLLKWGIVEQMLWSRYRIGYSDGKLADLLPKAGVIWDELKGLGILLSDGQERFSECVIFPVSDPEGNLVTIGGCRLDGPAENFIWLPGRPVGLWNAAALKSYGELIVVQSILEALSVQMAGFQNVVSVALGGPSTDEVATLSSYGMQRITLVANEEEEDEPQKHNLLKRLSAFKCRTCRLPGRHRCNSYLLAHGAKALGEILSNLHHQAPRCQSGTSATPGLQPVPGGFAVVLGLRRYQIHGLEKGPRKLKATLRAEYAGKLHVDTLDFYGARWRRQLVQDLTRTFGQPADEIEADVTRLMALCEEQPELNSLIPSPSEAESMRPEARAEAEAFGKDPHLLENILVDFERCGLLGEKANKLLCYLASVSRKMDKPLSVLILSSSGAGKTTLQDTALAFCPPEDLVKLTSISGKALFYKEGGSLKHKVLALEEGDGVEEAMYALRNLISAGELVTEATIRDTTSGRLKTMENRVEGPAAVFLTTTRPEIDPETKSRFFVTSVDESRLQTQAILVFQRQRQTLAGLGEGAQLASILQKHRDFQRLLKPIAVINPYADQLSYGDDRLQSRRDQPKYLTLIKAVAFLRQMQKTQKVWSAGGVERPYIEVDRQDIALANELAGEILGHSLDELCRPAYDLLNLLATMAKGEKGTCAGATNPDSFTRREIREFTGWSNARVHRHLQELIELEFVLLERGRNGVQHRYRLAYEGQGQDGRRFMLGLRPVNQLKD
jgi:hypothetical protein